MNFSNRFDPKPPSPEALEEVARTLLERALAAALRPDPVPIVSVEIANRIEAEGAELERRRAKLRLGLWLASEPGRTWRAERRSDVFYVDVYYGSSMFVSGAGPSEAAAIDAALEKAGP